MTALTPIPVLRLYDNSGNLAIGAQVYTYVAGTSTPQATYTDSTQTTPNTNPIVANSRGEVAVWLGTGLAYKVVAKDASGNLLFTSDNVTGADYTSGTLRTDLANSSDITKADALVGVKSVLANSVARTQHDKNADTVSFADFGAQVSYPDNAGQINNAVSAVRQLISPPGDYIVLSKPNNPLGSEFSGNGRIMFPITGGNQQLNLRVDQGQHTFGLEYLYVAHNKLTSRVPFTALFSGDSTTAGDSIVNPSNLIHNAVANFVRDYGFSITPVNSGHSGKTTEDWRTTYLAPDLATNPDIYIIRWGINDPSFGRTISDFATSLRTGLATIRGVKDFTQLPIILMTPNSTSDTPNGRDEKWYEQVRLVVRQAARDYQCAFIDTYALIADSRVAAGRYMDNAYGDGRAIHPLDVMNGWIAGYIADMLVPPSLRRRNIISTESSPGVGIAPTSYPIGVSTWRAISWAINGVSVDGALRNTRTADNISIQEIWAYDTQGKVYRRTSDSTGASWRDWIDTPPAQLVAGASWVSAGKPITYEKINGSVQVTGRLSGGTTTAGTVIATLPVGCRPAFDSYFPVVCGASLNTAAVLSVTSGGAITVISVSSNAGLDLSPIRFSTLL